MTIFFLPHFLLPRIQNLADARPSPTPRHALTDTMPLFSSPVSSAPFLLHPARHVDIATVVYRVMQQTTGPPVVNRVQRHSEYRDSRRFAERAALGRRQRRLSALDYPPSLILAQKFLEAAKIIESARWSVITISNTEEPGGGIIFQRERERERNFFVKSRLIFKRELKR